MYAVFSGIKYVTKSYKTLSLPKREIMVNKGFHSDDPAAMFLSQCRLQTFTVCPNRYEIRDLKYKWEQFQVFLFQSPSHSLYTHTLNPLCWLQSLIPSIPHRQVVFFIGIKLIIFHACTHAATVSYTFTRYYLSKVSWLWNTPFKLKVGNVPKPDIISCGAFLGVKGGPVSPVCQPDPRLKSAANCLAWASLCKSVLFHFAQRAGELTWALPDDWSFLFCDKMKQ